MRTLTILCLLPILISPQLVVAGKLSRARDNVRASDSHSSHDDDDDDDRSSSSRSSGKLDRSRNEVRRDSGHSGGGGGGSCHRPRRRDCGCNRGGAFFSWNCCDPWWSAPRPYCPPPTVVETYVVSEPREVIIHPGSPELHEQVIAPAVYETFERRFASYPYALGCDGFQLETTPDCGGSWAGRVQAEVGSDFDGIDRTGVGFLVESIGGFGFDFDWDSFTEDLPGGGHDELHLGEFNFLYRVAETDRSLVRVGLGAAWLGDAYDTDFGINFTVRGDFAPADPWILSGELDLGTLGDAQHVHATGSIGVMLNRCEIFGGYDYHRIGDVEISGPMIGARLWF